MKRNVIATTVAAAALMMGQQAVADVVHLDDTIVTGSVCAGFDCVNGESFGFDTLRLKENNLRIKFQDTSNSGSFPTNDWQITANDSSNGGANKFSIEDIDGGKIPFTIIAGAPSNALYVNSSGDVGFGTSTPVVDLHTANGNTPTLRLEQNSSSGFTAQTWDMAGNEANFFIRDATNGSTLPFRIQPSAPSDAIFVASSGNIGLGTSAPKAGLHILGSGAAFTVNSSTQAVFQNSSASTDVARISLISGATGNGQLAFGDTSQEMSGRIRFNHSDDTMDFLLGYGNAEAVTFSYTGNVISTSTSTAVLTAAGVWQDASSRDLKKDIHVLSLEEATKALDELAPVTYRYKNDSTGDMNVGFIAEEVPELVATSSRKTLASLDLIAVLTKVVQDQKGTIVNLEKRLQRLEEESQSQISLLQ